jgi:ABC-2 type transport system ATP-binding protein
MPRGGMPESATDSGGGWALELDGISHTFGAVEALRDISLRLPHGVVALVGANGAGKTTLIRLLVGSLQLQTGEVRGPVVASGSVGYVPQAAPPSRLFTAQAYLVYFGLLQGLSESEAQKAAESVLGLVNLSESARVPTSRLSGGMFRRLMLGAGIIVSPQLLVLDEPTVGLDPIQRDLMLQVIRDNVTAPLTLFSTHLIEDVAQIADWVVVLRHGSVAFTGTAAELTGEPVPTTERLRAAVSELMTEQPA